METCGKSIGCMFIKFLHFRVKANMGKTDPVLNPWVKIQPRPAFTRAKTKQEEDYAKTLVIS